MIQPGDTVPRPYDDDRVYSRPVTVGPPDVPLRQGIGLVWKVIGVCAAIVVVVGGWVVGAAWVASGWERRLESLEAAHSKAVERLEDCATHADLSESEDRAERREAQLEKFLRAEMRK